MRTKGAKVALAANDGQSAQELLAEVEALKAEVVDLRNESEALKGLRLAWLADNDALREENAWLRGKLASRGPPPPYVVHDLDAAKLDPTLSAFEPFTRSSPLRQLLGASSSGSSSKISELRGLEEMLQVAVATAAEDAAVDIASQKLSRFVARLQAAYDEAIQAKLKQEGIFKECYAVIAAANRCFQGVYEDVWRLIVTADAAEGLEGYRRVMQEDVRPDLFSAQPTQTSGDAVTLYKNAVAALKPFRKLVFGELGGGATYGVGPLKNMERVVEKGMLRADKAGNATCCDLLRALAVCHTMSGVADVVKRVLALEAKDSVQVVRIKDRFLRTPCPGGWRDTIINFIVVGEPTAHVVELQIVHEMLLHARKGLPSQYVYGHSRNAMEIIEKLFGGAAAAGDALVLANFFETTGNRLGDKGWMSDRPLSQWEGVTTNAESKRVTALQLQGCGLANDVPIKVAELDCLTVVDFGANPDLLVPLGWDEDDQMSYAEEERTQAFLQHLLLSDELKAAMQRDIDDKKKYGAEAPWLHKLLDELEVPSSAFDQRVAWFEEETDIGKWAGITTDATEDGNICVVGLVLTNDTVRGAKWSGLSDLSTLGSSTTLRVLDLTRAGGLLDVSGLDSSSIQELNLDSCPDLTNVSALGRCSSLRTLNLSGCEQLTDVSSLGKSNTLQTLELGGCAQLKTLSGLGDCGSLQTLGLQMCLQLTNVSGLGTCKSLRTANLNDCALLQTVSGLGGCEGLQTLSLQKCSQLSDVSGLGKCKSLRTLTLDDCALLQTVSELGGCEALETLSLQRCLQLPDISGLAKCKRLEVVHLDGCSQLSDLSDLGGCKSLYELNVKSCVQLTTLSGLGSCGKLGVLNLSQCIRLADVHVLEACSSLRKLNLKNCKALQTMPDLSSNRELDVRDAPGDLQGWVASGYKVWPPPESDHDEEEEGSPEGEQQQPSQQQEAQQPDLQAAGGATATTESTGA